MIRKLLRVLAIIINEANICCVKYAFYQPNGQLNYLNDILSYNVCNTNFNMSIYDYLNI